MMDGEYILLNWQDRPEFFVIRGHISAEEAKRIARWEEFDLDNELGEPYHTYAAWLCTGLARLEGWDQELRLYDCPGRGRFKVTVLNNK